MGDRFGGDRLAFAYEESFCTANQLGAYERLIHDALIGPRGWHLPTKP